MQQAINILANDEQHGCFEGDHFTATYSDALKVISRNAYPIINKEIDRILEEKLPFVTQVPLIGKEDPIRYSVQIKKPVTCYAIPDHGYLPQRYVSNGECFYPMRDDWKQKHETETVKDEKEHKAPKKLKLSSYRLGHSIDWWISHGIDSGGLCDMLTQYVDGIATKFYNDMITTLFAAAYYRNVVYSQNTNNDMFNVIRRMDLGVLPTDPPVTGPNADGSEYVPEKGVQGLTDLFVDEETYYGFKNVSNDKITVSLTDFAEDNSKFRLTICPVEGRRTSCTVHRTPELGNDTVTFHDNGLERKGGAYYNLLTLSAKNGGFGLVTPRGCRRIMLGMNRNYSDEWLMYKQAFPIYPDNSSYTHRSQTLGFYGWARVACASIENRGLILGALE